MITDEIIKEQALLAILNATESTGYTSNNPLLDKVLTHINNIAKVALDIKTVSLERDFNHANENKIKTSNRKVA